MNSFDQVGRTRLEQGGLILFLAAITLFLGAVAWPFISAIMWAAIAAIMFQPLYRRILRQMRGHENRAALLALLTIFVAIVIPSIVIGSMIVDQATAVYFAIQAQEIDAAEYFTRYYDALPERMRIMLDNSGYGDFSAIQARLSELIQESVGAIAARVLAIGGGAFSFFLSFAVGLYVTYFLLRDGRQLGRTITDKLPLEHSVADRLAHDFVGIVRATIKGSVVVGLVQGALGAITFWIVGMPAALLFGLLMAIFSLLPALGPAIVWIPVAVYLLVTGAIWQGVAVIASGILVIGLADNLLRPILVGRDTGIPDWIVLITTLGGIAVFGLSGIVIGPVVAGLFLAGWTILAEQRGRSANPAQ